MFELKKASKRFDKQLVLSEIDFLLPPGRITAVFGASGCGKTTLMRALAGLITLDQGQSIRPKNIRCSFVFQEDRLLPWRDTITNLTALGINKGRALLELAAIGLADDFAKLPQELSGGMQRRLAIARAIAFDGEVFFLDEPLQGLDLHTMHTVLPHLKTALQGKTALLITHDPQEAFFLADRIVFAKGPPFTVIKEMPTAFFPDSGVLTTAIKAVMREKRIC